MENNTNKKWKFVKTGDCWWLCISTVEQFLEYTDKTSMKYGQILIKDAIGKEMSKTELKYMQAIKTLSYSDNKSLAQSTAKLQSLAFSAKLDAIISGHKIWINENGGFNYGMSNIDKVVYMKKLMFPNYTKADIKITKANGTMDEFDKYIPSKHFYAKVGEIEVKVGTGNDTIIKWDTYEEAYNEALKYCIESN